MGSYQMSQLGVRDIQGLLCQRPTHRQAAAARRSYPPLFRAYAVAPRSPDLHRAG